MVYVKDGLKFEGSPDGTAKILVYDHVAPNAEHLRTVLLTIEELQAVLDELVVTAAEVAEEPEPEKEPEKEPEPEQPVLVEITTEITDPEVESVTTTITEGEQD